MKDSSSLLRAGAVNQMVHFARDTTDAGVARYGALGIGNLAVQSQNHQELFDTGAVMSLIPLATSDCRHYRRPAVVSERRPPYAGASARAARRTAIAAAIGVIAQSLGYTRTQALQDRLPAARAGRCALHFGRPVLVRVQKFVPKHPLDLDVAVLQPPNHIKIHVPNF